MYRRALLLFGICFFLLVSQIKADRSRLGQRIPVECRLDREKGPQSGRTEWMPMPMVQWPILGEKQATQIPTQNLLEHDFYKIQLSFDSGNVRTPWITLKDVHGRYAKALSLSMVYDAEYRVSDVKISVDLGTFTPEARKSIQQVNIRYTWNPRQEYNLIVGLFVLLASGIMGALINTIIFFLTSGIK